MANHQGGPNLPFSQQTAGIFVGEAEVFALRILDLLRPHIGNMMTSFKLGNEILFTETGQTFFNSDPLVLYLSGTGINVTALSDSAPMLDMRGNACVVIAGTAAWQFAPSTYSYRYRLTVSIDTDGQVHTGSSVIEVTWRSHPDFGNGAGYSSSIRGQAAFVDLGTHGAIVAALQTGDTLPDLKNGPRDAKWIAARAFGNLSTGPEIPDLPRLRGGRQLAPDNMPRLVWFSDPADPTTARVITPAEFTTILGPTARLVAADVEITNAPIVIDIDKKLPWYPELEMRQKYQVFLRHAGKFQLIYNMFIGADT